MSPSHRLSIVLLLALAGGLLAGVLLLQHHGEPLGGSAASELCGGAAGEESGCDRVNRSPYATVAGVPWAVLGMFFYFSIAALMLLGLVGGDGFRLPAAGMAFVLLALALLMDVGLFAIQAFRIGAYCKLCLTTYAVNAVALVLLLPFRRGVAELRAALGRPETRLVLTGWGLATLACVSGLVAAEAALVARENRRAASVLGERPQATPAPETTPTPEATAPPAADTKTPAGSQDALKAAQAEVKRLQEIIDDPQKYDRYQGEKSLKDFATGRQQQIDLRDAPIKGAADARIHIVEYSDLLCPFCRTISQAFTAWLPNTANRVRIHYKFYPLDTCNPQFPKGLHPGACWLAYGGVCANEQGKFWQYHDKVVTTDLKNPDRQAVVSLAGELGLDTSAFNACIGATKTKDRVVADINEGFKAGVTGTPSVFINGRRLPRTNEFLAAVDQESKRLGLGPMPAVP